MDIRPYNEEFPQLFKKRKEEILKFFNDCNIYHIGSTAVSGLGGKGIIDILITIDDWSKEEKLIEQLKNLGFTHIHERENNRRFISKEPPIEYKGTHLHITIEGSKEHRELINFRDYLRSHPQKAKEYFQLKKQLANKSSEEYFNEKSKFVEGLEEEIDNSCS